VRIVKPMKSNACLSDLALDRHRAGELSPEREHDAELHLRGCLDCRERRRSMDAVSQAYLADARSEQTLTRLRRSSRRPASRVSARLLATLAIAAAIGLSLLPIQRESESLRSKGALRFGFFVKRGERVFRGTDGERLRPGDQLRFTVQPARTGHVAILSLDSRGVVDVYYPAVGAPIQVAPREQETALAAAVELDASLGEERIYALLCERPAELAALRSELEQKLTLSAPAGCSLETLRIWKVRDMP
jgi:hypothetical protein